MTNKDTQIFQFNQSERDELSEVTPSYSTEKIRKWHYLEDMIELQIDLLKNSNEDFEVVIRRKNDE